MYSCDECYRRNTKYCFDCSTDNTTDGKPTNWSEGVRIPINHMEMIEPIKINHTFAEKDEINHPSHYTQGKIETIDYIIDKLNREQLEGYVIGNVFKYCSRYKLKGGYQDLKKARWYLDKLIELENN